MPQSSSKKKGQEVKTKQSTLASFFGGPKKKNVAIDDTTNDAVVAANKAKPKFQMHPRYRLKLTKVKHRLDDATFVEGKLVAYDGQDDGYTVQLIGEENVRKWTRAEMDWGVQVYETIGQRVAKYFNEEDLFLGTVTDAVNDSDTPLFSILYDDEDREDFNSLELKAALDLFQKEGKKKKKVLKKRKAPEKEEQTTKRGRQVKKIVELKEEDMVEDEAERDEEAKKKRISPRKTSTKKKYTDDLVDSDEEEEEFVDEYPKKKQTAPSKKRTPKKKDKDMDSDFEGGDAEEDDDDVEMDVEEEDHDMNIDEDDFDEDIPKRTSKGKKSRVPKNPGTGKKSPASKAAGDSLEDILAKNRESFKPNNNPQKFLKEGTYVEPVGVDPTDGIVEGIINAQVRKIGGLLLQATKHTEANPFGLSFPLKLQTACSGTDAPSIALGLIQESLDKLCTKSEPHGFTYQHQMSCEIEPFKQAYIGRNFPGVPLFPDICKLTLSEKVLDVYGRPQTIPEGNLFVAGTSCKDFSMLKTSYRLDIEDKGTSGETFLAAVEFLDQKQPPVAIFENVMNAPWSKMQEYIRGRLALKDRNSKKGIKDGKNAVAAEKSLKFSVNSQGRYVAEEIPRQVGIRAGDIVEGFVRKGDASKNVTPLVSDKKHKDLVTLGEMAMKHGVNLNADTLVMEKKARYCTHLIKVDSKDYGLPQTRQRQYLFIWRSDDPDDDLGKHFEEIFYGLKTPLLHAMEAFLLPDTHDRIRCFREALRSGRGRLVKRERAKELDFFNWNESRVKDLGGHLVFREVCGIEERARYLTGWQPHGIMKLAPGFWPELADMWNHRRLDLIDCFGISAYRDSIPRDPLHHSYTWDISQNVTRAPVRSATVGVCGCVTPGGELFLPNKGRTVMGYEKLSLQGIPNQRLDFGILSEVQQSDLAGNAMSVSVVCAAMLAAICAPEFRRERLENPKCKLSDFALSQKYDDAGGKVLAERGDLYGANRDTNAISFMEAFENVVKDLAVDAFRSSVLCTCESSGTCSDDPKILQCTGCGMVLCGNCFDRYRMDSHKTEVVDAAGANGRPDSHEFEGRLRCAVPSILRLGKGWEKALGKDGEGLESYSFELRGVERKRLHWSLTYGAWEDYGSGRQVAEIRVDLGKLGACDPDYGLAAFVRSFAPAIRHKNPHRGKLRDAARLIFRLNDSESWSWEFPDTPSKTTLKVVGSEPTPSQRVLAGLNDEACKVIKAHKVQKAFIPPIESRNNLLAYHPLWKTFPGTIEVSGDNSNRVNGIYHGQSCEQTIVHSALWCRNATEDQPAMYIYIRPSVLRAELDVAVISTTPSYNDGKEVCELLDWIPENALVEKTHSTKATFLNWKPGPNGLQMEAPSPSMCMIPQPVPFQKMVCSTNEEEGHKLLFCELGGLRREVIKVLLQHNDNGENYLDLYGKLARKNVKRLSIVAAPSLLKFAAQGKLPLDMASWYRLPASDKFGRSEIHVPPRPVAKWRVTGGRKGDVYERYYDEQESIEYYQRLASRPPAFQAKVDEIDGKLSLFMNPYVAAHRAAAHLGGADRGALDVDYCLSELSSMGEPDTKVFSVPNSDTYEETEVGGLKLPLYPRQAKALTRMLAIENGEVSFSEEERSEHVLPGIGWCLIGRASRKSPLRGGVLGDAIGSGKTVVTIALILAGAAKARASRDVNKGRSSATLIVVPPGLVRQWDDERAKFTQDELKCIIVDSTETLKKKTVEELCAADMVIVPAGIVEDGDSRDNKGRPYTEQLSDKAGAGKIPPAPASYSLREAPTIEGTWIRNMASGPDIYVGNKGSQRKRDDQAYYSHCYSQAIAKLRQKTFSPKERGVPIEYFTWERIVIDECHETLVTGKKFETTDVEFKEKARRGAREFLGVAQTDVTKRPLLAASGCWGLTGTPLLETEARVTELANLMGGTYLTGASHHWRKEETDSGRDLFLNQSEATQSREYRCAVQESCHSYVKEACQRNRGEQLEVTLTRKYLEVKMSEDEGRVFLKETEDLHLDSFTVQPDQLGEKAAGALTITASSKARHAALLETIDAIGRDEPETKIIVFANSSYGGYDSALSALKSSGKKYCHISDEHSVQEQNERISWFRHVDATAEDRARARVLLLSFEQAAGHNLQEACHNVILYDPQYSGQDAVADASVEEQAVGRVMRQGQKYDVTVTRIVAKGPNGEPCLDDWIVQRNMDKDVLAAATSNFD